MKARFSIYLLAVAIALSTATPSRAFTDGEPETMVVDVLVARPACFVATVAGSAVFVLALPFALISNSTDQTAKALVVKPAWATFKRPIGDFSKLPEE